MYVVSLIPTLPRAEIIGFLAGFGTTFAAVPDLVAMWRRRSSAGMNPRMATILGVSQVLWMYYGLLIDSRPVIAWNVVGITLNVSMVVGFQYLLRRERASASRGRA